VFTDPELAWCGLTEAEAKEKGVKFEVSKFPWSASGRALSFDRVDGMTKMLMDPESGRVLGVGIVGAGAGRIDRRGDTGHGNGRDGGGHRAERFTRIQRCPRQSWNAPKRFTATRRTRFRRSAADNLRD